MMKSFILSAVLSSALLSANLVDHFKKITDEKTQQHSIKNVDFIYMINLDQRPEKYALCLQKLLPFGILPYRFSAVNGWELSMQEINELGIQYGPWMTSGHWGTYYSLDEKDKEAHHELVTRIGQCYYSHCLSRGAIGIVLSHLSILQDAYDSGYETIWVMEDDIEVIQDPNCLGELIEKLDLLVGKGEWDILFTDRDTKDQRGNYVPCTAFAWRPNFSPSNPYQFAYRFDVSSDFLRIGARYGAYSMIVRRSGMKKILDFLKRYDLFLPYDMEYTLPPDIRLFTVASDVVSTQPQALSDNGSPGYLDKLLLTETPDQKIKE